MRIFIVGPMASGKSLVGPELAKLFKLPFFDSDKVIESKTGVNINWIFEKENEEGFRKRETTVLKEISKRNNFVLSTGGGSILKKENREIIKTGDHVIYLQTSVNTQIKRTKFDKRRPLIDVKDKKITLNNLAEIRNPLYEEVATLTIQEKRTNFQNLIKRIAANIE